MGVMSLGTVPARREYKYSTTKTFQCKKAYFKGPIKYQFLFPPLFFTLHLWRFSPRILQLPQAQEIGSWDGGGLLTKTCLGIAHSGTRRRVKPNS